MGPRTECEGTGITMPIWPDDHLKSVADHLSHFMFM